MVHIKSRISWGGKEKGSGRGNVGENFLVLEGLRLHGRKAYSLFWTFVGCLLHTSGSETSGCRYGPQDLGRQIHIWGKL